MALLTSAGLFLLAGALHELDHLLPPALTAVNFMTMTAICLGLALCWAASIRQRIMNRTVRRLLVACALLAMRSPTRIWRSRSCRRGSWGASTPFFYASVTEAYLTAALEAL